MALKEALLSIPELVKILKEKFSATSQKFADITLEDGTILRYDGDTPVVGGKVQIVNPDQSLTDVPDGTYTLPDGTILETESSLITAVTPGSAAGIDPEQNAKENKGSQNNPPDKTMTAAQAKQIIESVIKESNFVNETKLTAELKKTSDALTVKFKVIEDENKALKESLKKEQEFKVEVFALLEKLGDEASVSKARIKKTDFKKKEGKSTAAESLAEFRKNAFN